MMNKQRLNKLYELAEQLKHECCDKYTLLGCMGSCCYDSGEDKVEYCPFDMGGACAAESFIDSLNIILDRDLKNEMLNNEYKKKAIKKLENISTKELINLLKEVGSTRVDDGQNVESGFEGG